MSWELATEDGQAGQFASAFGFIDLRTAIRALPDAPHNVTLKHFLDAGLMDKPGIPACIQALNDLATDKHTDEDVSTTALGLAKMMHGHEIAIITQGGTDAVEESKRKAASVDDNIHDLTEAPGEYYYELEGFKRWILGDGGTSGNCDLCNENADQSWIPEDDVWPNADDVPCHPNCTCTVEEKERRVRYYY